MPPLLNPSSQVNPIRKAFVTKALFVNANGASGTRTITPPLPAVDAVEFPKKFSAIISAYTLWPFARLYGAAVRTLRGIEQAVLVNVVRADPSQFAKF